MVAVVACPYCHLRQMVSTFEEPDGEHWKCKKCAVVWSVSMHRNAAQEQALQLRLLEWWWGLPNEGGR